MVEFLKKALAYVVEQFIALEAKHLLYLAAGLMIFFCGCHMRGCWDNAFRAPPPAGAFGWVDDPAEVAGTVATMPQPRFATAGLTADDKDALLYAVIKKALGHHLPPKNQGQVGSCVGHGYSEGVECLSGIQQAQGTGEYKNISPEATYALSRVEVGKGRIGRGDGSVGAWAAKACTDFGSLPMEKVGGVDLSSYSEGRCKQWGNSGLPDDLEPEAAKHKVGTAAKVDSAEEARVALTNLYPVVICSGKGFSMQRDSDGFCREQGRWGHCMLCCGYRADKRGFLFFQSWGPTTPSGPLALDQPPNSFWVTWQVMDQICREGDTFALSQFAGFPKQNIDNFVRAPGDRRPFLALAH